MCPQFRRAPTAAHRPEWANRLRPARSRARRAFRRHGGRSAPAVGRHAEVHRVGKHPDRRRPTRRRPLPGIERVGDRPVQGGAEGDCHRVDGARRVDDEIGRGVHRCALERREVDGDQGGRRSHGGPPGGHLGLGGHVHGTRRRRVEQRLEVDPVQPLPALDRPMADRALAGLGLRQQQRPRQQRQRVRHLPRAGLQQPASSVERASRGSPPRTGRCR